MKIENPAVTLADEARCGVKEEVRSGFLDWLHQFSVTGEDGELYAVGGAILSMQLEQMDVVSLNVSCGRGRAVSSPNRSTRWGVIPACCTNTCGAIRPVPSGSKPPTTG